VRNIKPQSRQVILFKKFPSDEDEEEDEDEEPPATLKTFPPDDFLASSAALNATSNISPQCLHFFASFFYFFLAIRTYLHNKII
jgi:hypothetical protein